MEVIDDGKLNPRIVITTGDVLLWLRKIADEKGYADRALSAVQIQVQLEFGAGMKVHNEVPQLVLMVSNIANSRA